MTGLLVAALLLASPLPDAGTPDAGAAAARVAPRRSVEDEEVIRELDLLQHLAESESLDLLLELNDAGAPPVGR